MRHFLISLLLLGLVAGCSSVKIGPHRIDVQQGNALDQENLARLKPGLNRSQVRFLLGTPLVVDPFRNDRWDYVYVYYKAGKLAEQKRISLFFEGDTLARIEGDLPEPVAPAAEPRPEPQAAPAVSAVPPAAPAARAAEPAPQPAAAAPQTAAAVETVPAPAAPAPVAAPVSTPAQPAAAKPAAKSEPAPSPTVSETRVVAPLPSPKNAPPYVDPHTPAEPSLTPETNVERIQPDLIPSFPEPGPGSAGSDDPVLKSVDDWAAAWSRRDTAAYFAAYDDRFVPQDGSSRAVWEQHKRQAMDRAKSIEVRIDAPTVERAEEGTATVTFQQFYRAGKYRDAVVKQLLMVERDGRWLIIEEKVLSVLRGARP